MVFACFAPSFAANDNESKGRSKASKGSMKRSSKRDCRVKPIDDASPSTSNGSKKRKSKLGLRVKHIDIVFPTTADGYKKRSKWGLQVKPIDITSPSSVDGSKKRRNRWSLRVKPIDIASPSAEDGSKKRISKWGLRVKPVDVACPSTENATKELCLPVSKSFPSEGKIFSISPKMVSYDSIATAEPTGKVIFEVGGEHDEIQLTKRDCFDLDLEPKGELASYGSNTELNNYVLDEEALVDEGVTLQAVNASGGLVSDPCIERTTLLNSPVLTRSCSNVETKHAKGLVKSFERSNSYTSLSRSKDPEKLFSFLSDMNKKDAHSSDMHEPDQRLDIRKNRAVELDNKWVASSSEYSHMDRVDSWVNSLEDCSFFPVDVEEHCDEIEDEQTADLHNLGTGEASVENCSNTCPLETEEVMQHNSIIIIQSLNSFSSAAHISSIGLKVLPSISAFVNLRYANLSGNCLVQITQGSLPKSLHTLDLSRNKISSIEGLRDLERLRILNLSHNRITRIGHGLSSCTLIKELYLAGNKISVVEGLHRVLKLTVLDLSFNKITTAKALGQLVANYNCLLALNLIGNPIQTNIGEDQLKKEVVSLLPHVTYLNKQSIKPDKVNEVPTKSVAKAALGDGPRRKMPRRLSQGSGLSSMGRIGEGSVRTVRHSRSMSMQSVPRRR